MLFESDIRIFCTANGMERYYHTIREVFLEEVGVAESEVRPHEGVSGLLDWNESRQGLWFWASICFANELDDNDKEAFVEILLKYAPKSVSKVEVFTYEE